MIDEAIKIPNEVVNPSSSKERNLKHQICKECYDATPIWTPLSSVCGTRFMIKKPNRIPIRAHDNPYVCVVCAELTMCSNGHRLE